MLQFSEVFEREHSSVAKEAKKKQQQQRHTHTPNEIHNKQTVK